MSALAAVSRPVWAASLLALGLAAGTCKAGGQPADLCAAAETRFFACQDAKQRWINLCGTMPSTLQYRFGRAGQVALRHPENAAAGKDSFVYARYFRFQTERVEVGFQNRGAGYAVFDYREGRQHSAGVRVTAADGKTSEVACAGRVSSRLRELEPLLRCDNDNALNGGKCP